MEAVLTTIERRQELLNSIVTGLPLVTIPKQVGLPETRDNECYIPETPYPYGWRYLPRMMADGHITWDKIALTLEENLHPEEDDYLMPRPPHSKNTKYIGSAVEIVVKDDPTAFVSDDLNVDLNLPGVKPVRPDIAVFFDVAKKKAWGTFDTQKEGTKPTVAFEVTSPSTRHQDFGEKYDYYARAGILYYVILDIEYEPGDNTEARNYTLHVYHLLQGSYEEMQSDDQGRYWLPPLEMFVGVGEDGILCYDAQGNFIQDYAQISEALADTRRWAEEQERIAEEQEQIAKQEAERAEEQERIANCSATCYRCSDGWQA